MPPGSGGGSAASAGGCLRSIDGGSDVWSCSGLQPTCGCMDILHATLLHKVRLDSCVEIDTSANVVDSLAPPHALPTAGMLNLEHHSLMPSRQARERLD